VSAFVPLAFAELLEWAVVGLERERSVFGLPQRSFWKPRAGLDLSVAVPGGRAETPLGPAAGPHTQLAQNLVAAWLAGARVLELKTVQVLDRLDIPRPCIDAPSEGYNVEWSQELALGESLEQYVAAWALVHVLAARGLAGEAAAAAVLAGRGLAGTRFDASVGYDLEGVRSAGVARFLDGLADAGPSLESLRASLPAHRRPLLPAAIPAGVIDTVTLSTFHGCPPREIDELVRHLFDRHRLHVVVKLNPTLLGYDAVAHLLHDALGRRDIALDREAFARDLQWEEAVPMLGRLSAAAAQSGLQLGVKLTNTLVVRNRRGRLAGERVYLSGAPLHPLAMALAARMDASPLAHLPRALSAGVDAGNFAEAVACGFAPVTTCTDLLRPTGYRRLPRYLKALAAEFERTGAADVAGYVAARAREAGESAPAGASAAVAASRNLARYAARLAQPPSQPSPAEGGAEAEPLAPAELPARRPLALLDCDSCNRCVLVCPNAAFFAIPLPPQRIECAELRVRAGAFERTAAVFETRAESQWLVDAGLCNACGNCDTWCPQSGGPWRTKPRLHRTRAGYEAEAPADGILIEAGGDRVSARFGGIEHRLERVDGSWEFRNDALAALLGEDGAVRVTRVIDPRRDHPLDVAQFHTVRALVAATLAGVNPAAAGLRAARVVAGGTAEAV